MYTRKGTPALPLGDSPSLQQNNLSFADDNFTYVRLTEVIVCNRMRGETHRISLPTRSHVCQAKYVAIAGSTFLVVASSIGVQVFTPDGHTLKFFLPITAAVTDAVDLETHYMCGIAGLESGYICVGSSVGTIAVIRCDPSAGDQGFSMVKLLTTRQGKAIFATGGSSSMVACGNDFGDVYLFDAKTDFEQLCEFRGFGHPCTSVVMNESVVVCAYASGYIRMFRSDALEMAIEVTAHMRSINALALHPELRLFASCGEDQYIHVWALPEFHRVGSGTTELLFSERIPNRFLTGISFCKDGKLAALSYDEEDLILFSKIA